MKLKLVLVLLGGLSVSVTQAQSGTGTDPRKPQRSFTGDVPPTVADSVAETLKFAEGNFLGVAEAMPENKYDYLPTTGKFDDARSFGEQVKHVACAQFAFFKEFEGKNPPEDCEPGGHIRRKRRQR